MKLAQVIQQVNEEKPNSFKEEKLTGYINEVEAEVQEQLGIKDKITYEYGKDSNKELIVTAPYDKLYKSYLKANIDYANEEYASYENNQAQHIADFRDYADYVVRNGLAVSSSPKRFKNIR